MPRSEMDRVSVDYGELATMPADTPFNVRTIRSPVSAYSPTESNRIEACERKLSRLAVECGLNLSTVSNKGLDETQVKQLREQFGYNEVITKQTPAWLKILKLYFGFIPIILTVGAIVAVAIPAEDGARDWLTFGLLFFLVHLMTWADYFSDRSAKSAIKAIEALAAPSCRVKRSGAFVQLPIRELVPGDIVSLKAGIVIPADGVLIGDGEPMGVDESSLTGESLPVTKRPGDELLSGAVIQKGEMEMVVTKTGENSFYGKTIALLGKAETIGHLRRVLDLAAVVITCISVVFAIFMFFWFMLAMNMKWYLSLQLSLVLVASVAPAAMPLITTTVLAVGAVQLSKEKTVVSRLSSIEEAAGMQVLCSDKTGTLTKNVLTLYREEIVCEAGVSPDYLLMMASLAGSVEDPEPIDKAINQAVNLEERKAYTILKYVPFNPVDKKATSTVEFGGEEFLVCKGAPHVIMEMVTGDNDAEVDRITAIINSKASKGLRTLGVAKKEAGLTSEWQLLGYISLFDPPRDDTAETIRRAREMGIDIKMITGDQQAIAIETARQLQMGTNIVGPEVWRVNRAEGPFLGKPSFAEFVLSVNGFSGVYPEHKFNVVDAILRSGKLVGMTGDGVNDAPALKLATVGIAVAGATEAAKSAADIILLDDGLSPIITAFKLSRKIFRRVEAYIIFRIYTSMLILWFYCVLGVAFRFIFPTWTLVLIATINDFTLMSTARDRVPAPPAPQIWNMRRVTLISVWMAIIAVASIVVFYALADPSMINWWPGWGIAEFNTTNSSPQMSASLWILMTMLIQLVFHCARTRGFFFHYDGVKAMFPSFIVLVPQSISILLTLFLAVYWPADFRLGGGAAMTGIGWYVALVTLFWGLLWFLIIDLAKVFAYRIFTLKWEEMSLSKIFGRHAPDEIEMEREHKLKTLIQEELDRRYNEKEVDVLERVEDHKAEITRYTNLLPPMSVLTVRSLGQPYEGCSVGARHMMDMQARKIVFLESKVEALEAEMKMLKKLVEDGKAK